MAVEITFIRHGQTDGNAAGRWQGHTNSSLTELGRQQATALGQRLAGRQFDLVVSSDLDRAMQTAAALRRPVESDERWREPFFGSWENLTTAEVMSQPGDGLRAVMAGEDVALGGGEHLSDVAARTTAALEDVVERVHGDGSVAVVSHGLSLLTLFASLLGTKRPAPLRLLGNTSIAELVVDDQGTTVSRYNDNTHLGNSIQTHFGHDADDTDVLLVRHGQTSSNIEGRWQGHQDGRLNGEGRRQIKRLAASFPQVGALYASPLRRAADTAAAIAGRQELEVTYDERLKEICFGAWEGLTTAEIVAQFPEESAAFFNGSDMARGGTGETFVQVRERIRESLGEIAGRHQGESIAVVSHGGVTRAWVTEVLGLAYDQRIRLSILGNTGYARLAFGSRGPSVVSWNLSPHLEDD